MSERVATVGDVLFQPAATAQKAELEEGEKHPKLEALGDTIKKELRAVDRGVLRTAILRKLGEVMNDPFFNGLAAGWNKADEILQYRDHTKFPPESTFLVELAEHTVESKYEPTIDILINGVVRAKLSFNISLAVQLKGFEIEIRDAKIMGIHAGHWQASGLIGLEGHQFYSKSFPPVPIPGWIPFGEGIPIGE